ncbi:hypothetical protein JOQ06_023088, partial [Pogonophryne albipinna]
MPEHCAAYSCANRRTIANRGRGITFHKFPKDKDMRKKWEVALRREGFTASESSVICSEHFKQDEFDRTGQIVRLRDGVIPSIFSFPVHLQRVIVKDMRPLSLVEGEAFIDMIEYACPGFKCLSRWWFTKQLEKAYQRVLEDLKGKRDLGRSGSGRPKTSPHNDMLDSVLGDRPTSGFGSTVNSLSLTSIMLQDESLNVRSSFDAVKRKRDLSSGLLEYLEKSDDREERLEEQAQAMLKELGQAMLQE